MTIHDAVSREIIDLHTFFEAWLSGQLPNTDEAYQRFEQVVTEDFTLVTPSGEEIASQPLLAQIRSAWGARPVFKLWVEEIALIDHQPPLVIARYIERQTVDDTENSRLSTAIFREASHAPNGLLWLRVHETWLNRS